MEYIIKTKHRLLSFLAIVFPCVIIFADDNPLGGFAALVLQASLIGWIPAVIWAWKVLHRDENSPAAATTQTKEQPKKASKQPPRTPK